MLVARFPETYDALENLLHTWGALPWQRCCQFTVSCASLAAGETREPAKTGSGMSAQRNFLASVLKPGKRQHLGIIPQQVGVSVQQFLAYYYWHQIKSTVLISCCGIGGKALS